MTEHVLGGLDGASPLHTLASLGLLRLLDGDGLSPRLGWAWAGGAWTPRLSVERDEPSLCAHVAERLRALGLSEPPSAAAAGASSVQELGREVREIRARLKKLEGNLAAQRKAAKTQARQRGLRGEALAQSIEVALSAARAEVDGLRGRAEALELQRADALGEGVAHLGDKIGVPVEAARRAFDRALRRWWSGASRAADRFLLDQLSGVCCDMVAVEGLVVPTPFSFSNGGAGQFLLKDFRGCAAACTPARVAGTLFGGQVRFVSSGEGVTGLNWDPEGRRQRAHMWENPETLDRAVDVAANGLAYLGLGMLPTVPSGQGLAAVGWGPANCWSWPIWEPLLPPDLVRSLLADAEILRPRPDAAALRSRGVTEVRRSERISDNKRFYFAPSAPV